MAIPKVCLGCFSEWNENNTYCSYCGWAPEKTYGEMFQWRPGDILEQRYLLGTLFSRFQNIAVWRVFDNLLKIPGYVLRISNDDVNELALAARKLQANKTSAYGTIVIQAIKNIDNKNVLMFSIENRRADDSILKDILSNSEDKTDENIDENISSNHNTKKEILTFGTLLTGRYRIKNCIGIGGFGITYLSEDILLNRNVAIKEYFPSEWAERDENYVAIKHSNFVEAYRFGIQSFMKEASITAKFIHTPQIVTIYDVFENNDTAYMVMEYLPGISIGREIRLREYKPYSVSEMAEIIVPVLDALEDIHKKRIIHSDISPGNIMRTTEKGICLIDMGAAKYNLESQPVLNAAFLKVDYAAPEQYRTAREGFPKDEGPWTDIYSVGATIYFLLTGHKPTDALTRLSNKNTDLISPKKYGVKLSKKWMKFIHHTMELKKEERFHSVSELKRELNKLLS